MQFFFSLICQHGKVENISKLIWSVSKTELDMILWDSVLNNADGKLIDQPNAL